MSHITFDPDQLLKKFGNRFDLGAIIDQHGWPNLLLGNWPISIALLENYRKALIASGRELGQSVPVDRFVFARGEPSARHLTKFNGLPYRPKGLPWPCDVNGAHMGFFFQFCFADSHDVVQGLPGEVLLVFARTRHDPCPVPTLGEIIGSPPGLIICDEYADSLRFEWYPLGIKNLVDRDDIPYLSMNRPTCYGVRHRSVDYVDTSRVVEAIRREFPDELKIKDDVDELFLGAFAHQSGMKIGGIPIGRRNPVEGQQGSFIGSFSGIGSPLEFPYPMFGDEPSGSTADDEVSNAGFAFYEDAWLNFVITSDGRVNWDKLSWYNVLN